MSLQLGNKIQRYVRLSIIFVGLIYFLLRTELHIQKHQVAISKCADFIGVQSVPDGVVVGQPTIIEAFAGKVANLRGHSILYVKEVRFKSSINHPLKHASVEESDVRIWAEGSCR
jgi:hypothetical protein